MVWARHYYTTIIWKIKLRGKQAIGRPRAIWKEGIKKILADRNITWPQAKKMSTNRKMEKIYDLYTYGRQLDMIMMP